MRYINKEFEKEYETGADFISEFVVKAYFERLEELEIQEFCILPEDMHEQARVNIWKRVQSELIRSLEYIKETNFGYDCTVLTIIDEVKGIIKNKDITSKDRSNHVLTWIIYYTMSLFVKDDRLKKYKRKKSIKIDVGKNFKEQILSSIILGEEYSDQMCSCLGVYEAAKLLNMNYLIPIVEISVAVCVWAKLIEKDSLYPQEERKKGGRKIEKRFSKSITKEQAEKLFDILVEREFIINTTGDEYKKIFLYYCGYGRQPDDMQLLQWNDQTNLLGYLFWKLYNKDTKHWSVIEKMFGVSGLAGACALCYGFEKPPTGSDGIDNIIKQIKE